MRSIICSLCVAALLAGSVQAEPVLMVQQSPKPGTPVTLPDGRLVPYSDDPAARVICRDTCQPAKGVQHRERRLRGVVLSLAAGAVAGGILLLRLTESKPEPEHRIPSALPPAVSASPVPSATPQAQVPEPATLLLLLGGLSVMLRRMTDDYN